MNTKKRIEYIDALRGFTMLLVVTWHIYAHCFMQDNTILLNEYGMSYNNLFRIFRMPLFFFISGFVFYKNNKFWDIGTLISFITSKIRVQLFSTLVFFLLYCFLFQEDIINSLIDLHKSGYWFTYVLFIYYILYLGIDIIICVLCRKSAFNLYTIITSLIGGFLLFYLINNGFLLSILSPQKTTLLSINKWQYFIFFSFGCFIHKYYDSFLRIQNSELIKGGIITLFVSCTICIFYQNNINHIFIYNYILKLFISTSGIMLIMFLFKKNESKLLCTTKIGNCLQYIGKHTLDIYFLHYFFLPYDMAFVGNWLEGHPNPLLEFLASTTLAFIVVT